MTTRPVNTRPVLGIICCNRQVRVEPAQAVMERYVRAAMVYGDVAALLIPSLPDLMTAAEVAPRLDGILLTGSPSNVEGVRYGSDDGDGPFDAGRDEVALGMIEAMIGRAKPVFGICRGFQEINVALGGTLRRDVSSNPELLPHHAPDGTGFDAMFDHHHRVALTEGGILSRVYQRPELEVNSVHYQGIGTLAPDLIVEAEAEDGLIEAYSATLSGAPILAVQWHPEWATSADPDSQTYFRLLGKALRGDEI
jgi:putative glutamine amidotransferase